MVMVDSLKEIIHAFATGYIFLILLIITGVGIIMIVEEDIFAGIVFILPLIFFLLKEFKIV